jgi:Uncharacterised nucleotidyltransferase
MSDSALQSLVLATLQPAPDFSHLDLLRQHRYSRPAQQRKLLRWLDQSGLALYFLHRLQQHSAADHLPPSLREALEQRAASNRTRTTAMLDEFRRLTACFAANDVQFCVLKGFALTPEFCPAPHLRHQTDFDFLVAPGDLAHAARALESLGPVGQRYAQTEIRPTGQLTFATPLLHVPTAADDIYALPRHCELDLLPSLQLDSHGALLHALHDPLARIHHKTLGTLSFPALADDDAFSLQVLHTFSHLLGSWVRVSWLFEVANFLDQHRDNAPLWNSVIQRQTENQPALPGFVPPNPATQPFANREAFGLILALTQSLFTARIPQPLADWCLTPLPAPIAAWVAQFGRRFAYAELDGTKLTLFIHGRFFQDGRAWPSYVRSRLFPFGRRSLIGSVSTTAPGARIRATVFQWLHSMRRALFHLRELLSWPVEAVRWKRALLATHRQRALMPPRSNSARNATPSGSVLNGWARFPD